MKLKHLFTKYPALDEMRTSLLTFICTNGVNFFDSSFPITKIISPKAREFLASGKPMLVAFYHGHLIGTLQIMEDRNKLTALISRSRDGEFLARMVLNLGYKAARGSPAHKAVEGAMQLIDSAKAGSSLIIAVDGPRGPYEEPKEGVIRMAEITGLPLLPFVCKGKKNHYFWGWDKMMGCYYGSPITFMIGDPIYVPDKLTSEERENYRQQLANYMKWLKDSLDQYCAQSQTSLAKQPKPSASRAN
jgi:lysophospholipid acyltransferase (LPLAT)-like uncharacterized protein